MVVINPVCRWCELPIKTNNKTGLCRDCLIMYQDMLADINCHDKPPRSNPKDECACGKKKDARATMCRECYKPIQAEYARTMGINNGGRRRHTPLYYGVPNSGGRRNA